VAQVVEDERFLLRAQVTEAGTFERGVEAPADLAVVVDPAELGGEDEVVGPHPPLAAAQAV
jgi:hypothetical protein